MKRIISFAAVVMTMFMAASCSREQMDVVDSDTATMTLTVNMPDAAVTKAYGDGTFADKNVIIGVFDETGKQFIREVLTWKSDAFSDKLDITLFRGKKYQMVFWAQYGNTYGEPQTMPLDKITIDYAKLTGNLETRDAFYAYVPVFEVTGDFTKSVDLVRPFAQVNFATVPGDIEDAGKAGLASKGTLTIKNAAKTLDLFTGKTSDYGTVTIPETAFPMLKDGEKEVHQQITVLDTKYDLLSMNYILVADDKATDGKVTTELTFVTGEVTTTVPNANMKRNYRTNVVGKLLTGQGSFTVTVDPVFGSPDYVHDAQAITHAQLQEKIAQGLEGTYQIRGEVAAVKATEGKTGYEDVTLKDKDGKSEVYTLKVPEVKSADTYSPYYKVGDVLLVEVVVTKGEDGKCVSAAKEEPYAHYPAPEEKPDEPVDPEDPEDPDQPVDPEQPGDDVTTVADFLAAAEDETVYTLSGTITRVVNTTYGNFDLTDDTGTVYIYGLCSPEGAEKYWAESGAKLGDDIVIKTVRTSFNNSPQGENAIFVSLASPGTRPFMDLSKTTVSFTAAGGSENVDLAVYNWTEEVKVTSDNEQFSASYSEGKLTIIAKENNTEAQIKGTITISVGKVTETVNVIQAVKSTGESKTIEIVFKDMNYANGESVDGKNIEKDGVTFVFAKGGASNSPAYYTTGEAIRMYQNGATLDVSAGGSVITSIEITFADNQYYIAADSGEFTEEAEVRTWSGEAINVKFTSTGTDKNHRAYVQAIKVTYK